MGKDIVHDLYRFIKEDVTKDQMFEATDGAYKGEIEEGKLPKNLNNVDNADDYIQDLKEDEKKKEEDVADNPEIKTANAGVTEDPEDTTVSKELNKETPDIDALTQNKDGVDPNITTQAPANKDEKNAKVEVSSVEEVKTENEGKVPADPGKITNPDEYIQDLKEEENDERILADGISEESVARDLANKNDANAVQNPDTQLWSVISKTSESIEVKEGEEDRQEQDEQDAEDIIDQEDADELEEGKKEDVKEDIDVQVKAEDKEINIVSAEGSTQVTTLDLEDNNALVVDEPSVITPELPIEEEPEEFEDEEDDFELELSDEDALEMAEKLMVVGHLEKLGEKATPKQQEFIKEVKSKKFSKKNIEKIANIVKKEIK